MLFTNTVFIMKTFYYKQIQILLILFTSFLLSGIFGSYWLQESIYCTLILFWNKIFCGNTFINILLWILIDVVPYTLAYIELTQIIKEKNLDHFNCSLKEGFFAGVFFGFDLVWIGYFWHQYLNNFLIIATRIIMPAAIMMKFWNCCNNSCSTNNHDDEKQDNCSSSESVKKSTKSSSIKKINSPIDSNKNSKTKSSSTKSSPEKPSSPSKKK